MTELLRRDEFSTRHIGPDESAQRQMLAAIGAGSVEALMREVVPHDILLAQPLALGEARTEAEALAEISAHAGRNDTWRNFIGTGYYGTHTPAVIQRKATRDIAHMRLKQLLYMSLDATLELVTTLPVKSNTNAV